MFRLSKVTICRTYQKLRDWTEVPITRPALTAGFHPSHPLLRTSKICVSPHLATLSSKTFSACKPTDSLLNWWFRSSGPLVALSRPCAVSQKDLQATSKEWHLMTELIRICEQEARSAGKIHKTLWKLPKMFLMRLQRPQMCLLWRQAKKVCRFNLPHL